MVLEYTLSIFHVKEKEVSSMLVLSDCTYRLTLRIFILNLKVRGTFLAVYHSLSTGSGHSSIIIDGWSVFCILKEMGPGNFYRLYPSSLRPCFGHLYFYIWQFMLIIYIFFLIFFSGCCENRIQITKRPFKIN